MRTLETEGIVLRCVDTGESDRILRMLTPVRGRVSAVAKGARRSVRRFSGTLDLFNHLRVQIDMRSRSSLLRLDQARLVHAFPGLRIDLRRFALASYLLELLDRLAPEGGRVRDSQRLFAFACSVLHRIETDRPDPRLRVFVALRALAELGLRPELARCVRCGGSLDASDRVGFHIAEGGPLCGRCAGGVPSLLPLHLGTLRALDQGLRLPLDRLGRLALSPGALAEAERLCQQFERFHLGFEPRSETFLAHAFGPRGTGVPSANSQR